MKYLAALIVFAASMAAAQSSEPRLGLDVARSIVARTGVNVGTVFADEAGRRFMIADVRSASPAANTFTITVRVRPLP